MPGIRLRSAQQSPPFKPYNRSHMQPAPSTRVQDGFMATMRLGGEKPHQGVPGENPALYPVRGVCNSTVQLGLRGQAELNRIGSCCTGKERDQESGNDYFFARYYSSAMGRFLSPDWAAKAQPVPYAKLDDPQTLNLYGYLRNNPLGGVDADGHCGSGPNDPPCTEVKVEAKVTAQPTVEKNTEIKDKNGNVIAHGTGPTGGKIVDTVTANGKPLKGVKVAEQNNLTQTRNGKDVPGQLVEGTATTNAKGQFQDNISMQAPTNGTPQRDDAIVSNFSGNAWRSTDVQTLTLTLPGGESCSATSTRTLENYGSDSRILSSYSLSTTQPVVTTPNQ